LYLSPVSLETNTNVGGYALAARFKFGGHPVMLRKKKWGINEMKLERENKKGEKQRKRKVD